MSTQPARSSVRRGEGEREEAHGGRERLEWYGPPNVVEVCGCSLGERQTVKTVPAVQGSSFVLRRGSPIS